MRRAAPRPVKGVASFERLSACRLEPCRKKSFLFLDAFGGRADASRKSPLLNARGFPCPRGSGSPPCQALAFEGLDSLGRDGVRSRSRNGGAGCLPWASPRRLKPARAAPRRRGHRGFPRQRFPAGLGMEGWGVRSNEAAARDFSAPAGAAMPRSPKSSAKWTARTRRPVAK
jgi:hypothetical protein